MEKEATEGQATEEAKCAEGQATRKSNEDFSHKLQKQAHQHEEAQKMMRQEKTEKENMACHSSNSKCNQSYSPTIAQIGSTIHVVTSYAPTTVLPSTGHNFRILHPSIERPLICPSHKSISQFLITL